MDNPLESMYFYFMSTEAPRQPNPGWKRRKSIHLPPDVVKNLASYPLTSNLHVSAAGFFPRCYDHGIIRPNGFPDHILLYVADGRGWLSIASGKFIMTRDTLALIPANMPHAYAADNRTPWSLYWFTFNGDIANEFRCYLPPNQYLSPVAAGIRHRVISLFEELVATIQDGHDASTPIYASKVMEHLLGLLLLNNEALASGLGSHRPHAISRSIRYMRQNLQRSPTLHEMARQASLSDVHFWRLFKKQTGFAPMDYFVRMKIQTACQLLNTTALPLKAIAGYLGYADYYYFSRVFRKVMGLAPSRYPREILPALSMPSPTMLATKERDAKAVRGIGIHPQAPAQPRGGQRRARPT